MDGSSGKGGMVAKLGASFFADPASMGTGARVRPLLDRSPSSAIIRGTRSRTLRPTIPRARPTIASASAVR